MPLTDVGIGAGNYNPVKLAQAKAFVKGGAGETKFGFGAGSGGGGSTLISMIQEDEVNLKTGFLLDVWDPALCRILAGEI